MSPNRIVANRDILMDGRQRHYSSTRPILKSAPFASIGNQLRAISMPHSFIVLIVLRGTRVTSDPLGWARQLAPRYAGWGGRPSCSLEGEWESSKGKRSKEDPSATVVGSS